MKLQTKQDFYGLLFDIINPLKPYYTKGRSGVILGRHATWYDDAAARCESFSRPLWGLVPYFAGGGEAEEFQRICLDGFRSGTDKENPEYWGECADRDQRFVEMAAMAYGMIFCPDKLWDPLSETEKENMTAWLSQINSHEVCDSNWIFFRVFVNVAFKLRQIPAFSADILEKDLDRIDDFYVGGGWYMDGVQGQKDYYIPFAIQFYSLIYALVMEEYDGERCKKYKMRACEFAKTFIYWFAQDGEALPYGRSLTYRFAQVAFFSACILAKVYPFSVGVMKGIIVRNLEKWYQSDMFDNSHILTVGYKYPNLVMAEHYNSYGGPYWGLKTLAFLMLDENDEFFKAAAEPLPKLDELKKIPAADMIIKRTCGEVCAYVAGTHENFGCGQIIPKYLKFAYSTKYGFNVMRSNVYLEELAPDNMLCFNINGVYFTRNHSEGFSMLDNGFIIRWSAFSDIKVETRVIITPKGHKRIHKISSPYDMTAYDCGFAIAARDRDNAICEAGDSFAYAHNDFSGCKVTGSKGRVINASPNTNIIYNKTVIPVVEFEIKKGETVIETEITED